MLVVVVVTFRCQLAHVTSFLYRSTARTPISAISDSDASFYEREKQTLNCEANKQLHPKQDQDGKYQLSRLHTSDMHVPYSRRCDTHVKGHVRTVIVWKHMIFEEKDFWQA